MTIDYESTARALSQPILADRSPSPTFLRPPWNPRRSQSSRGQQHFDFSNHPSTSLRDKVINEAQKHLRRAVQIIQKMSLLQRSLLLALNVFGFVMVILFFIYNEKIFGFLKPFAVSWKSTTGGWMILWALVFLTAFPPIIGYSTCCTLAGFVYGIGEGWLILSSATIVGSTCSFLVSRFVLRSYVERLVAHDQRFAALTLTLKHDGLRLLCMIRLCPLPYSLSNGGISTIPTVHPLMYALATALVTPKLFIAVFIGSRMGKIAENGEQMSSGAKAVNWISIFATGMVGLFTGWYIYQRTMARAHQLEAENQANVRRSFSSTGAPPAEFLDDPEAYAAAVTLGEGDDDVVFFDDSSDASGDYPAGQLNDEGAGISPIEEVDDAPSMPNKSGK